MMQTTAAVGAVRERASWGRGAGLLACVVVLGVAATASLGLGARQVGWLTAWEALVDFDGSLADHIVVRAQRVPRTAIGVLAGGALGVAGAQMQGLTRNPLAGPGILGINAGAALFVALGIFVLGVDSLTVYAWFGLVGAGATAVAVYAIGEGMGGARSPIRLVLAGAAMTGLLSSVTTAVLILDVATLDEFRFWVVGSISGRDGDVARQVTPFIVVGLGLAALTPRSLNAIAMGDEVARSLGVSLARDRALVITSVVCLAGGATAAAGPIGFVGLAVPHVARAIAGPDYRWILPLSGILGATLLLGADVVGRFVVQPGELQVGIVTAFVGAPVFVAVARSRRVAAL
jgi:iron complex transport system permease protein